MNKIYQSKYCAKTGTYVAVSELTHAKRKTKNVCMTVSMVMLLGGLSSSVMAAQCSSLNAYGGGTCEIYEGTYTGTIGWGSAVSAASGNKTVVKSASDSSLGNFTITSSTSSPRNADYGSTGFNVNNGSLTADALSATITPESGKTVRTFGAQVWNAGTLTANTLNTNITFARENTVARGPIESYAVQVGTALAGEDRAAGKTSKVTVKDANITITNTAATQTDYLLFGSITVPAGVYQLSGIRVISREDGGGSNAIFESTGKLTINAFDSSTTESGDYINGIYISGHENKVILNDSEITIGKSGSHSAALKIGKVRTVGTGGSIIESKGNMVLDTTAESRATTVRVNGDESKLLANFANSSGEIKSAGVAIDFSSEDYRSSGLGQNQEVRLKDTKITTLNASNGVDNTKPLININEGKESKNATALFELSGDSSSAVASDYGWLIDVKSNAALTVNNADKGFMTGLTNIALNSTGSAPNASQLTANLDNGFTWNLNKKQAAGTEAESTTATLTNLTLSNQAVLNGAYDAAGNNNYTVKALLADGSMGTVSSDNGIINLVNAGGTPAYNDTLTIDGNYVGSNGASVRMNTKWYQPGDIEIEGGNDSVSDVLHILGTASGITKVVPVASNGTENFIDGNVDLATALSKTVTTDPVSIVYPNATLTGTKTTTKATINTLPVVIVDQGNVADQANFIGTADTAGAGEVLLTYQDKDTGVRNYYWTTTLEDTKTSYQWVPLTPGTVTPQEPPVTPPTPPVTPPEPPVTPPTPEVPIYKHPVSGVVQMPQVNMEQGFAALGTLHERRGDGATMAWDSCGCIAENAKGQVWGRVFGKHLELDGRKRFNLEQNTYGFQFGHDFNLTYNPDTKARTSTGAFLTYAHTDAKFYDEYRFDRERYEQGLGIGVAADKLTGRGKSDAVSLGLSHTRYAKNGSYVDLVGNISYIHNKYKPRYADSVGQKGYGIALSAEAGRPWAINDTNWVIEPQAQLMYQMLHLNSFKMDKATTVDSGNYHALRGRVGARLIHYGDANKDKYTETAYLTANIYHDFISPKSVRIGTDNIREKYNRTWWEVGAGVQLPVTAKTQVYGDVRYEHSFGGTKRAGYKGSIGIKYSWK